MRRIAVLLSNLLAIIIIACCGSAEPNQHVQVTALMARGEGNLEMVGKCLRVDVGKGNYLQMVWPPDYSVTVNGDIVHLTEGLVSGNQREYDLRLGDHIIFAGGGAPYFFDQSFFQVSPTSCPGPYWIFGGLYEK